VLVSAKEQKTRVEQQMVIEGTIDNPERALNQKKKILVITFSYIKCI
jgi:hypothetical protein